MLSFQIGSRFWVTSGGASSTPELLVAVHARHHAPYRLRIDAAHRAPYALQLALAHHAPYGDMARTALAHHAPYGDMARTALAHHAPYWLMQSLATHHALAYSVTDINPVSKRMRSPWALLAGVSQQSVASNPELTWRGQTIGIIRAGLSCDEGSPVWLAKIELASMAEFAQIAIGESITLTLGLEVFAFVVDGKTLSRDGIASQRCELSAVSPVALLDAPFAGEISRYEPAAIDAETAVESLIGAVDWQLPAWTIPAGRLQLENVTPLGAARNIVEAIGGFVESHPDGSVVCRKRYPVSVPQYATTPPAASLFDGDVLAVGAQIAPQRGFNRVTISNEEGSSSASDRAEYVADESDDNRGIMRAYIGLQRPVTLVHTGNPATVISSSGAVVRSETETVEFIEGQSSTRYPVTAISSAVWQHTNLGTVAADGSTLIASTQGYSLLQITYTTTALEWRVACSADEEVQFVLIDS